MNRGYIKLYRKITDSQHFSMGLKHIGMFDYLLLKANWKTGYFQGVEIKPGELGTSLSGLADLLHEDRRTIRKLLDDLELFGMIKRQPIANRWTHLTVCKWDAYQLSKEEDCQPNANQCPKSVQQSDHNQRSKEVKEVKEDTTSEDWDALASLWNSFAKPAGLQTVRRFTTERKSKYKTRLAENPDFWDVIAREIPILGDFAKGIQRDPKGPSLTWTLTLDFCLNSETNFTKLAEGRYRGIVTKAEMPDRYVERT